MSGGMDDSQAPRGLLFEEKMRAQLGRGTNFSPEFQAWADRFKASLLCAGQGIDLDFFQGLLEAAQTERTARLAAEHDGRELREALRDLLEVSECACADLDEEDRPCTVCHAASVLLAKATV